jgi:hypothetical protein
MINEIKIKIDCQIIWKTVDIEKPNIYISNVNWKEIDNKLSVLKFEILLNSKTSKS